jgi:hypothetical protein
VAFQNNIARSEGLCPWTLTFRQVIGKVNYAIMAF